MTTPYDFDRSLVDWLDEAAAPQVPDYFDELLDRTRHTRQRPAWASLERWLPMQLTLPQPMAVVPRVAWLLLVLALIVILGALALAAAGGHRLPPPLGPAGNGLIALDEHAQISVRNPDGSGQAVLTTTSEADALPVWSADGTKIAFYSFPVRAGDASCGAAGPPPICDSPDQPVGSVVVMNADGQGRRVLVRGVRLAVNGVLSGVTWAHDGTRIAYASTGDNGTPAAFVVTLDGLQVSRIDGTSVPTWSPDDRRLADVTATGVYVTPSDGSGPPQRVSDVPGAASTFGGPAWAPNGKALAFFAGPPGNNDVFVVGVDGTGERAVASTSADEYRPVWSPDGTELAFERVVDGNNDVNFVVVDANGSNSRQLATPVLLPQEPIWSPDGRYLVGHTLSSDLSTITATILVDTAAPEKSVRIVTDAGSASWQRVAK